MGGRWRVGRGKNPGEQEKGGAVICMGRGHNAQKSGFQPISRHTKFRVPDLLSD